LTCAEQQKILDLLRGPRFVDLAPTEIYACLLDEGVYLCSIRTMYRILAEHSEVRERRRQLRHPVYQKPELRKRRCCPIDFLGSGGFPNVRFFRGTAMSLEGSEDEREREGRCDL
jgi:hypothetical protein